MMGLSAKKDDTAIGFFGTGFKYAIATLLRLGATIEITARSGEGYTTYNFYSIGDKFRGKEFECIYCESEQDRIELPFTTHLGANWKAWQAYRELFTNAKDEGGGVALIDDLKVAAADIVVSVTDNNIAKVFEEHDKYFLNEEAVSTGYRMRCVQKRQTHDNVVYYKSMYTGTRLDKPTFFTYDYVKTVDLTEDRTLADTWYIRTHIGELWACNMDYDTLVEYLPKIANQDYFENSLDTGYHAGSEDFLNACAYLNKMHRPMPMWARDMYIKTLPFDQQIEAYKPTRHQKAQLAKAIEILAHHKYMIDLEKLHLCTSLPSDVLGYYRDGNIYIAKEAFDRGFEKLLGTLYEEWLHMHEQCDDMSRSMQNILVDRVASLMEQVYDMEQVV